MVWPSALSSDIRGTRAVTIFISYRIARHSFRPRIGLRTELRPGSLGPTRSSGDRSDRSEPGSDHLRTAVSRLRSSRRSGLYCVLIAEEAALNGTERIRSPATRRTWRLEFAGAPAAEEDSRQQWTCRSSAGVTIHRRPQRKLFARPARASAALSSCQGGAAAARRTGNPDFNAARGPAWRRRGSPCSIVTAGCSSA